MSSLARSDSGPNGPGSQGLKAKALNAGDVVILALASSGPTQSIAGPARHRGNIGRELEVAGGSVAHPVFRADLADATGRRVGMPATMTLTTRPAAPRSS
jgi:hypothetical protein